MSSNTYPRFAKILLLLIALWPLALLPALGSVRIAIGLAFRGGGSFYIPSLNVLMVVLTLWAISPAVAAGIARWSGVLTTRGTVLWVLAWTISTAVVLGAMRWWEVLIGA